MDKTLKKVIERTIEMKRYEVQDLNFSDMTEKEKKEYEAAFNKVLLLEDKLKGLIPKDLLKDLIDMSDAQATLVVLEQSYMFSHGVKIGLNELSYIKEELGSSVVLL